MKRLFIAILCMLPMTAVAQNQTLISQNDSIPSIVERIIEQREGGYKIRRIKSNINLEFYTTANAYFTGGKFDEMSFKMNRVRLEFVGKLNENLSYHFRQSFNKYTNPYSMDNISSSIEYANITWQTSEKFSLVAGKQFVALGGYEAYVNAMRLMEFCDFNNSVAVYQTGLMGVMQFSPSQQLILQVVNNRSGSDNDLYLYGRPNGIGAAKLPLLATLNWNGLFLDDALHFRYSASAGQLAKGKNIYYLTCGNVYEKEPYIAYIDVMYSREGIDSQQRITALQGAGLMPVTAQNTQYLSFIANFDYQFSPKWNAFIKGAYETAGVYEANGIFRKGRFMTGWQAQACLEWFPFTEEKGLKVFAHYLYKGYDLTENAEVIMASMPHTQRISLGMVYVIPVL
ncbi:MAG: porin [Bacteroidales bacterium]|nr:porin [Bacteroidales bacterium]